MAIQHSSTRLEPDVHEEALKRIGYFDDTSKRGRVVDYPRLLGWFVKLPSRDLTTSPAASHVLRVREEVRALQEEGSGGTSFAEDDASVAAHLPHTQRSVAQCFEQLTKTGRIEFEEFKITPSIFVPRFRGLSNFPYRVCHSEQVEPFRGKGLLYLLFLALKFAGDRLRTCDHCHTLFVQMRRKQRYCTRAHQQVASMQNLRKKRQEEQEAKKRKNRSTQKKGVTSHGKKRR